VAALRTASKQKNITIKFSAGEEAGIWKMFLISSGQDRKSQHHQGRTTMVDDIRPGGERPDLAEPEIMVSFPNVYLESTTSLL